MIKTKKKDNKSKKHTPRAPRGNPPTTTDYSILPPAPITAPIEYHNSYNDRQLGGRRKTKKRKSLKRRNKNNKRRTGGRKLRNINPASIPE